MGVDRDVWGPAFWTAIHTASFAYPNTPSESQRKHMKAFIDSMTSVLPCPDCRLHFAQLLGDCPGEYESALENRNALTRFVVDIHNKVNERLGKPTKAYVDVAHKYSDNGAAACPLYTRWAKTAHGAYYCETRPTVAWISVICVAVVFFALVGKCLFRWHGIVRECEKKCPKLTRR